MNVAVPTQKLKPNDFASDQEVRWCPGCGDYAILKAVQRTLPDLDVAKEKYVFVSGIGCSSRFPYYMSTYGFHTIHGRAPAFATGIKITNPDLDVWLVTGDGDGFSIGGNHMLHVLRRNVDMQILLCNNEIYGLTKGQYSPTSGEGLRTPSSPTGSVDSPLKPLVFALGSGARFVARGYDTQKNLPDVFKRAHAHKGTSLVEILQNCIVYNDAVFDDVLARDVAADKQIHVEHGKPLIFGTDKNKGIRMNTKTLTLEVVTVGENGITEEDILVHDETNKALATMLAEMDGPDLPVALGVLYCNPSATYEQAVESQMAEAKAKSSAPSLDALLREGHTWEL
ncbi:2-oxoacid:ferredoxin oxidoreductase subunit beta [Sneathiella chinensis]|uniref:2-oxoglutarate ferredoxin oxidoreductase subunit beta n=1 Tax=Sneathiella chinensis TaxID=349750 RepID=A0ABQ5U155_9PROT|nr:2-oxoacid:ferredoxin oxidoreductase subunit beta [Sneathiella chinensis]GLQ05594.1 2-oxoglutarate ferredoxin oxidoreductase subunit beta [Sneathiella chinensis]